MGYRGFSAMEVGIRAVGRVRRCDVNSNNNNSGSAASSRSTAIDDDLRTTALDDIHQGKVVDWFDDPLDEEQKIVANEYTENIVSILRHLILILASSCREHSRISRCRRYGKCI